MKNTIEDLKKLYRSSRRIAVITGAGISTNCGIPDFRGPNGLYSRKDIPAELLFDIDYFRKDPTLFYTHIGVLWESFVTAEPSPAHKILAGDEQEGKVSVITQNIDGLHQKAGSKKIVSAHGDFTSFYCMSCGEETTDIKHIYTDTLGKKVPRCACGGVMKPRVVFFGEGIIGMDVALRWVQEADFVLVIGSSLQVYPVASLPLSRKKGVPLAIINKGRTGYDEHADIKLDDDIDKVMIEITS
jgi:NAD-dependent deacetylase